jgi:hypothetical protein
MPVCRITPTNRAGGRDDIERERKHEFNNTKVESMNNLARQQAKMGEETVEKSKVSYFFQFYILL